MDPKEHPEQERGSIEIENKTFEVDQNGFVYFGSVARDLLEQQSQYASRYVDGAIEGYPNLGDGLRFEGNPDNYHELKIHKDDIVEFVDRVRSYKKDSRSR